MVQPSTSNPALDSGYYDLGSSKHLTITTFSPTAQLWFTRGLIWSYAFNHAEAASCFKRALEADPECAMAYWGLAYALGPNYNKTWEIVEVSEAQKAREVAVKAKELCGRTGTTGVEKALIEAIQSRFPSDDTDHEQRNENYANAMGKVYEDFKTDLDISVLYADALMNLTPWTLWSLTTGDPNPGSRTLEIRSILESTLSLPAANSHPGLLHLYIHLMEMSPWPELALPAANHLRGLVPDAGHLQHMPSHIDILCGDYASAISSNTAANEADAKTGGDGFYTMYRAHNFHFKIYAAMFAGQSQVALDTASALEEMLPEDVMKPMADCLEAFMSVRVHVLIRFGRWTELIDLLLPEDQSLYCVTTAMIHYGKGVAFAATGNISAGDNQRVLFREEVKRVPETRLMFNNTCLSILTIASAMLDGELEYRLSHHTTAFSHLQRAIKLDDELPYDEPWGWMQPARHAYGALLLEQGKVKEAREVYAADLGMDGRVPRARRHLGNVWALRGLWECLVKLGRVKEARGLERELKKAEVGADVEIRFSCFCRLEKSG